MIKKIFTSVLLIILALTHANASVNYDNLEAKAKSFIKIREWNSAYAMYLLMMESRPNKTGLYSHAIVLAGLMNDDKSQLNLLEQTQKRGMPLDSIFFEVNNFAFSISEPQEYEQFLQLVKTRNNWLSRHINIKLLDYYSFRNDANNIIEIGNDLLSATPDNIEYLSAVARGYFLIGKYEIGVNTYKHILGLSPDDYDSLISLGNYYYFMWDSAKESRSQMTSIKNDALNYFKQAYKINPTPFIQQKIKELELQ